MIKATDWARDLQSNVYNAIKNQPNNEITLFREWCGSYGFDKYGKDVIFYKLYSNSNLDYTHSFEITDNVSKQIKEINNDLYCIKSIRNVALYLDNEE